jgi:hypothetical protein
MRRSLTLFVVGLLVVLVVTVAAAAKDGGRPLSTTLVGLEERPGPGDPNATGFAALRLNQGQNRVCYSVNWANVDGTVFAAHIHRAPAGSPGPVVVDLFVGAAHPGTGSATGCTAGVDAALIKAIRKNPSAYYVNVHSTPNFPGGAVRGQLGD